MKFYMTELRVSDLASSLAWYREVLGLTVTLHDVPNGFALLEADGGRVALKHGEPGSGVTLHFQVESLEAMLPVLQCFPTELVQSAEGYRELFLHDPDGHRIGLFEWQR